MKESGITPEIRQEAIVKNIVEIKIRKGHTLSKNGKYVVFLVYRSNHKIL